MGISFTDCYEAERTRNPAFDGWLFHRCHQHRDFLPPRMPRGNSQAGKLPLIKDERTPPNNRLLSNHNWPKAPDMPCACCQAALLHG